MSPVLPLSGQPDSPENYHTLTYELRPVGGATQLTLLQDNNQATEDQARSQHNWETVIGALKKLLESPGVTG